MRLMEYRPSRSSANGAGASKTMGTLLQYPQDGTAGFKPAPHSRRSFFNRVSTHLALMPFNNDKYIVFSNQAGTFPVLIRELKPIPKSLKLASHLRGWHLIEFQSSRLFANGPGALKQTEPLPICVAGIIDDRICGG